MCKLYQFAERCLSWICVALLSIHFGLLSALEVPAVQQTTYAKPVTY